jgi:hypothetical protein
MVLESFQGDTVYFIILVKGEKPRKCPNARGIPLESLLKKSLRKFFEDRGDAGRGLFLRPPPPMVDHYLKMI